MQADQAKGLRPLGNRISVPSALSRPALLAQLSTGLLLAAFYGIFIQRTSFEFDGERVYTLFDDAMISMRYAQNLAAGQGLTWNAGETAVEGFSNPLWTLWMAVLHLLGLAQNVVSLYVSISSAALLVATAFTLRALARMLYPEQSIIAVFAFWGTAAYYPLVSWSLRGMEVGLIALLLSLATLLALQLERRFESRSLGLLSCVLGLGILSRMEFAAPAMLVSVFVVWRAGEHRHRAARYLGLSILGALLALTAARLWYYGEWLPNTYYLKLGGVDLSARLSRGLGYLGLVGLLHLNLLLLLALAYSMLRRLQLLPGEWLLIGIFVLLSAYSAWVGGDAWDHYGFANRYIAPGVPLLGIVALRGAAALTASGRGRLFWLATGALWLSLNLLPMLVWLRDGALHSRGDAAWAALGLSMQGTTASDATIAVTWAGNLTYFSQRRTLDQLGKTDAVIAHGPNVSQSFRPGHSKWNFTRTFAELRPDLIAALYYATEDDFKTIEGWGYRRLAGNCFYRADTTKLDLAGLRSSLMMIEATPELGGVLCRPQAAGSYAPPWLPE